VTELWPMNDMERDKIYFVTESTQTTVIR